MKKNVLIITLSLAALAVAGGVAFTNLPFSQDTSQMTASNTTVAEPVAQSKKMTIWRDPNCGCCDAYAEYMEENGYEVTRIDDRNFDKRSIKAGVPERGIGCHLAMIDGYYVSGLVPVKIVERLVTERPKITGITLPGMPANAPGMARQKTGVLKTYAFGKDGITVYSNE